MLPALPIVLACAGFHTLAGAPLNAPSSPRSSSPSAIVTEAPASLRDRTAARPLAPENLTPPRAIKLSRASSAQPPLSMQRPSPWTRAMMAVAMGVAGMYAGAYVGAALDNSSGDSAGLFGAMIGMPIGGVLGGVLGWNLGR